MRSMYSSSIIALMDPVVGEPVCRMARESWCSRLEARLEVMVVVFCAEGRRETGVVKEEG